jgi:hypothetical protein
MDVTESAIEIGDQLDAVLAALAQISLDVTGYRALSDDGLLNVVATHAVAQRAMESIGAVIAGEIARRSAPRFGSQGLAQRLGYRTPEQLVRHTAGVTAQQAITAVRIGTLVHETADTGAVDPATGEVFEQREPWLAPVAAAVTAGDLSPAHADAIGRGLGIPCPGVSVATLREAAAALCAEAVVGVDPDQLFRRARQLRDEIDIDGVEHRELERRRRRALTFTDLPNGMSRLVWVMDPETAATVRDIYDRATSPKRGGVRFIDSGQKTRSEAIRGDARTVVQLASDVFEQLLRLGADVDATTLLGSGAPTIHIAATRRRVDEHHGTAHIRGQADPVSITTLERLACGGVHNETGFDGAGVPLDRGRDQRLFTPAQKDVLALKWGGCVHPHCNRPPSWTEAHHINHWHRDHGKSNIADGVLLCKHHHLLHHNNGWETRRDDRGRYWLTPPPEIDPARMPVELLSQSRVMADLAQEVG